jgi:hypothetical protein
MRMRSNVTSGPFWISNDMVLRGVLDRLGTVLPVYQGEMEVALRAVVAARGVSSLVGTLILLFFTSQLFAATRLVLNRVFQHKGRGFIHGILFDLGMILFLSVVPHEHRRYRRLRVTAGRASGRGFVLSVASMGGLMRRSPRHRAVRGDLPVRAEPRVRWSACWWADLRPRPLGKRQTGLPLVHPGRQVYSAVYGSLGVTIALMMWVYYSAIVFIIGAALIRGLEEHRSRV